jgi:cystathionine beta-synthase
MHRHAISQMPVVEGAAPAEDASPDLDAIIGVIEERGLLDRVFRQPETVDAPVGTVMEEPLPTVDAADDVETLFPLFTDGGNGAVVVRDGQPVGVITRSDLLDFVAHQRSRRQP